MSNVSCISYLGRGSGVQRIYPVHLGLYRVTRTKLFKANHIITLHAHLAPCYDVIYSGGIEYAGSTTKGPFLYIR
jgi:hypothetical protein